MNERKPKLSILPTDKASEFRWIHLPANNMAWVEALLTKLFIEEGGSDVEGFKALERSFSHQHRGQQSHSHFMRPLCQSTTRAPRPPKTGDESGDSSNEQGPPTIVINGSNHPPKTPNRHPSRQDSYDWSKGSPGSGSKENRADKAEKGKKVSICQLSGSGILTYVHGRTRRMSKAVSPRRGATHQNSSPFVSQTDQIALDQAPQHEEKLLNPRAMSLHSCHIYISKPRGADKKCKKL